MAILCQSKIILAAFPQSLVDNIHAREVSAVCFTCSQHHRRQHHLRRRLHHHRHQSVNHLIPGALCTDMLPT